MSKCKLGAGQTTVVLFVLAAALLLGSSIGGAQAALNYYSETYASRIQMYDIGVTLNENNTAVSWRNYESDSDGAWNAAKGVLLEHMGGEDIQLGRAYPEAISVTNSGTIDQYVRVSLYRYWLDTNGDKMQNLSPELIDLHLLCDSTGAANGWLLDEDATTAERMVLYYDSILSPGESTPALSDTLMIDGMVATKVTETVSEENGYTTITTSYDYNGVTFQLEAQVDAVQTHNAADAIHSAWGRQVTIQGDTLSLS